MGATAAAPLNVAPAVALVVGDPPCVRGAEVDCSMVTTEVTGCCGVETMTGAVVVERITVDGTGADATGVVDTTTVDTTTVDGAGVGVEVDGAGVDGTDVDGTGVDRAGLDAAGVEDTVVEGVGVDGGAETIVGPAANVVIPLHVSPLGQHSPPVMHCSPALQ